MTPITDPETQAAAALKMALQTVLLSGQEAWPRTPATAGAPQPHQ